MDDRSIALSNHAISTAIDAKVSERIHEIVSSQGNFAEHEKFLDAVKTVDDPVKRSTLLKEYVKIIEKSQDVRNETLAKLSENEISLKTGRDRLEQDLQKRILDAELQKSEMRLTLFSNRAVILFFMCFPIFVGIGLVAWKDAYFFAFTIIVIWYGMSLALYFSQASALEDLIRVFKERSGFMDQIRKAVSKNA